MQDQKMIPASMWGGHVNLLKYGAKRERESHDVRELVSEL